MGNDELGMMNLGFGIGDFRFLIVDLDAGPWDLVPIAIGIGSWDLAPGLWNLVIGRSAFSSSWSLSG
jgi:hypothetical protein